MLQNARVIAFTVSDLLRENQLRGEGGGGGGVWGGNLPHTHPPGLGLITFSRKNFLVGLYGKVLGGGASIQQHD